MKKFLSVLSVLLLSVVLWACTETEQVDGAKAKLESAASSLNAIISDPSNITANFVVPTKLANGITAEWKSDQPGVVSFTASEDGSTTASVNRPNLGDGDAKVIVTATLSLKSELSDDILTQPWSITITVKENTVATIEINTIADILALRDESYDGGTYQVTIPNVTVFAKGDAYFAYDGTGVVQLYQSQTEFVVGKVYNITGALEWYFGIWEIVKPTGVLVEGATAQYPTKQVIESIDATINSLVAANEHAYPTVADGNFEPIYATITGKVTMIPNDTSNYNTYIIDKDATGLVLGTSAKPSNGLLVYYNTQDFAYIKTFNGLEVTMDVVIYTYRSNNLAFAIYYVGGPEGITANLTPEQQVDKELKAKTLPAQVYQAEQKLALNKDANGVSIAWSYTDAALATNALVDLATGAVTLPAAGPRQEVKLTATFTLGTVVKTKEFTILVGDIPLATVADVKAATSNALLFRMQGTVLGFNNYRQISVADASGAITIYGTEAQTNELNALVGKVVEIIGTRDLYNGLYQLKNVTYKVIENGVVTAPVAADLRSYAKWDAATLLPVQASIVTLTNVKVIEIVANTYGNVELVLQDKATLKTIKFFWDSREKTLDDATLIKALKVGDYVSFNNVLITWRNSVPTLSIQKAAQVTMGTEPVLTDAEELNLDVNTVEVEKNATANLVLPTTLANGTTVAWTSSHPAIIANDGTFVAPEATTAVTLTAVFTNGEATKSVAYAVSAKALNDVAKLIYTFDFGTVNKTGYDAGNLVYKQGEVDVTIAKDRAQINSSTFAPWDTTGPFLVLAPKAADFKKSFAIFDLTAAAYANISRIEFSFAAWNQNNVDKTKAPAAGYLGLEVLVGETWTAVGENVLSQLTANQLITVSFNVTGAAKYRIVYNQPNTTTTGNTDIAIGVDNVNIYA